MNGARVMRTHGRSEFDKFEWPGWLPNASLLLEPLMFLAPAGGLWDFVVFRCAHS